MDLVHSRAVRKPLVAIILSILKCMFYSRSIASAGVLTPPHYYVYGTELFEAKSIKMVLPCGQYNHCLHNIFRPTSLLTTAVLLASIIDKTTLRIGYVQFFVRTDHICACPFSLINSSAYLTWASGGGACPMSSCPPALYPPLLRMIDDNNANSGCDLYFCSFFHCNRVYMKKVTMIECQCHNKIS